MTSALKRLGAALLATGLTTGPWTDSAQASSGFDQCPATAFLVQDTVAQLYGVDVSTGYVEKLADNLATTSKVNGIGFNLGDGYLYGWSYQYKTVARIGSDYAIQPIPLVNSINDNFYVGDVTVDGSAYYVYKKGSGGSHGLWRISLDETDADYLNPVRIIDGKALSENIFDFAFHPYNGLLYSVTSRGELIYIDPNSGSSNVVAQLSERGTFGAVYFDVDGNLYFSRNTDGAIFRTQVESANPEAVWYSQGPKSSQNDGARCALAPVTPTEQSQIDFGDAPDSYGTTLDNNGARHNLEDSTLLLGSLVDAEQQAWLAPNSDDTTGESDEDGVVFVSDLVADETALIAVETTGSGFLNGWIDFDRNGSFEDDEQIIADRVASGTALIAIGVPADIETGSTWSRFRVSSSRGTGPTGGVADGEVEDHPVSLFGRRVTTTYFPGPRDHVTLAFEDLWPSVGDYDMNDLVMFYRTALHTYSLANAPDDQFIDSVEVSGAIQAVGASFSSGFGIELTGVPRSSIDEARLALKVDGKTVSSGVLEEGAGFENAVFIVFDNVQDAVESTPGCNFYRTEDFCGGDASSSEFTLTIPVRDGVSAESLSDLLLNPFIFGTNARRLEVHLKNRPPTIKADQSAFGSFDDASDPANGIYYQTQTGLPWAMVIGTTWQHPEEAHDILLTYPLFGDYVTSGGSSSVNWHDTANATTTRLYQEQ